MPRNPGWLCMTVILTLNRQSSVSCFRRGKLWKKKVDRHGFYPKSHDSEVRELWVQSSLGLHTGTRQELTS